jgi:homeodomain-containing protein
MVMNEPARPRPRTSPERSPVTSADPVRPDPAMYEFATRSTTPCSPAISRAGLVVCRCLVMVSVDGRLLSGRSLSCRTRTVAVASPMKRQVTLSARDREELFRLTTTGVHSASAIRRARVLLALDTSVGEPDPKDVITARLGVSNEMLRLIAKRFAESGGDVLATVSRRKRGLPPVPSPVTGEVEARLIALACSQPPPGHARWSLRLLERHVELTEDIPNLEQPSAGS